MLLEVRNLNKYFGSRHLLCDINLSVMKGEAVGIIGASGSGKSTLLKCLNCLEDYEKGYVLLEDQYVGYEQRAGGERIRQSERRLNKLRYKMGIVFQSFNLFPHLNVLDNLILAPIFIKRVSRGEALETANSLLSRLGLLNKKNEYPSRLSGGEQQRVAIARTIAMHPAILLLDEVTSALDPQLVGEVLEFIKKLASEGMSMLIVTHELEFARDVCDRIIFIADGLIEEEGAPAEILGRPQSEKLNRFLGHLNRSK